MVGVGGHRPRDRPGGRVYSISQPNEMKTHFNWSIVIYYDLGRGDTEEMWLEWGEAGRVIALEGQVRTQGVGFRI